MGFLAEHRSASSYAEGGKEAGGKMYLLISVQSGAQMGAGRGAVPKPNVEDSKNKLQPLF